MKTLTLSWNDDDLTLEAVQKLAAEYGISAEQVIHRAIAEYLGRHVEFPPIDPHAPPPKTLRDLFVNHGLMKP